MGKRRKLDHPARKCWGGLHSRKNMIQRDRIEWLGNPEVNLSIDLRSHSGRKILFGLPDFLHVGLEDVAADILVIGVEDVEVGVISQTKWEVAGAEILNQSFDTEAVAESR